MFEERLLRAGEEARSRVEHGHPLVDEELRERLRRARRPERRDDELAAVEKCSPQLPDGEVERVGVKEDPRVVRAEPEPRIGRGEETRDVAMLDQHSLRLAGRSGGVDHVREAFRIGNRVRVLVTLPRELLRVAIDAHDGRLAGRQARDQLLLRHEHGRAGVAEDEGDSIRRVVGIERNVGAAGLEDGEYGDDEVERARQAERDERLASNAELAQAVREAVRPFVELPIRQRASLEGHRRGVGGRGGARLEQLVQAGDRVLAGDTARSVEHTCAFGLGQQGELVDPPVGLGQRALE